jgi:hypothetical protein
MVACCAAAAAAPSANLVAVASSARRSRLARSQASRRLVARAELPSLGAALRRFAAAAGMAGASQPWRDPSCFTTDRWWSDKTVAVVTGGNNGIGKEIVRQLSAQGLTAVLTSRDARLGAEAAKELSADVGRAVPFHQARPASSATTGPRLTRTAQLDVTDEESAARLARWLQESYGAVDILINNAGFAYKARGTAAREPLGAEACIPTGRRLRSGRGGAHDQHERGGHAARDGRAAAAAARACGVIAAGRARGERLLVGWQAAHLTER